MTGSRQSWPVLVSLAAIGAIAGTVTYAAEPQDRETSAAFELVQEALEAEFMADVAKRRQSLAEALEIDPQNPQANWLSGRVNLDGKWMDLAEAFRAAQKGDEDELYREKRSELDGSARKEHQLARWCAARGLEDRARLHFTRLLMNPGASVDMVREALRKLDLEIHNGRFMTKEEVAAEEKLLDEVAKAFKTWAPKLAEWQRMLAGDSVPKAKVAREKISELDDPRAIPVLEAQFLQASEAMSLALVARLAKFPQQRATETLAKVSVLSSYPRVRDAALEELKQRKLHDFVPLYLAALNPMTRSQFSIQCSVGGSVRYVHQVLKEGPAGNVLATKERTAVAVDVPLTGVARARQDKSKPQRYGSNSPDGYLLSAVAQAADIEQDVARANAVASAWNDPVFAALEKTTGQQLARDPAKWWDWWKHYNEVETNVPTYQFEDRYTTRYAATYAISQQRKPRTQLPVQPAQARTGHQGVFTPGRHSCFAPGTLVRTDIGLRPIETIQVGDRVLSQDPDTGELTFKLVLRATVSPPCDVIAVGLDGETITASFGHPFWINREGWRMTKELAVGDRLHGLTDVPEINHVELQSKQLPVHNLVVQGFHTYFVGQQGVLVHDNTYREPTLALVPGLVAVE